MSEIMYNVLNLGNFDSVNFNVGVFINCRRAREWKEGGKEEREIKEGWEYHD
jgi:hypothetical protein